MKSNKFSPEVRSAHGAGAQGQVPVTVGRHQDARLASINRPGFEFSAVPAPLAPSGRLNKISVHVSA